MVDVMKYIAAIMVICIHCGSIFSQEYTDFFIKNIICRIAVPLFFISSAYFVRKGSGKDPAYVNTYLKNLIKSYCLWSIVFIPIGLDWIHQNLDLAGYLLPFALLYGLIHIGTYYHLWYVPAMILAIYLVNKLIKRFSYKSLFIAATLLFLFGSMESYYGLLQNGWLKEFFDVFIKVVFTTRSGILYGMIFTLMGFYIYNHQKYLFSISAYMPILTFISLFLLIVEGSCLYYIERLDMNFMLMLLPFSFFFFLWILTCSYTPKFDTKKIRNLSKYYYFVHPVCIVIIEEIAFGLNMNLIHGLIALLLVIILTHLLSVMIIQVNKPLHIRSMIFSSIVGMAVTFILASIFFCLKPDEIIVKFELVPCIWFYSSFTIYYMIRTSSKMFVIFNRKRLSKNYNLNERCDKIYEKDKHHIEQCPVHSFDSLYHVFNKSMNYIKKYLSPFRDRMFFHSIIEIFEFT